MSDIPPPSPAPIRAARGPDLRARGWLQEAALRCLENNLDPEVAENPQDLVVYGGTGRAARDWESFHAIVGSLLNLRDDETLLVQSGKPVGILTTHPRAPRVLIANSLLVPDWATWDHFWELEAAGLMMYGQMTAGSWIYIGTQGILQGTFQTFAALAEQRFDGSLQGTLTLTAGLGGMGGAQPLAVTMNDGVALVCDIDPQRIQRRVDHGYLDTMAGHIDEAVHLVEEAKRERRALSVGVVGNAADVFPDLRSHGVEIDIVTDQTSAHDPLHGYIPNGFTLDAAAELRSADPEAYVEQTNRAMAEHCSAMVDFASDGAEVFDYGNNLRGGATVGGFSDAFTYPGFVPAYIRPLFCEGMGPFRWVALSGDPADIAATDQAILDLFPDNRALHRWIELARAKVQFQGLPARICWLGYGERDQAGERFNQLVASGEVSAPIVIGRDHLDSGSVASPHRETEAMADGSDAVADWPILNGLVAAASGAAWVALHHGGGVGMGKSIHAGAQVVADGTSDGSERVRTVLTNDPAMGVLRHADAGYDRAREVANDRGVRIPIPATE